MVRIRVDRKQQVRWPTGVNGLVGSCYKTQVNIEIRKSDVIILLPVYSAI